MLHVGRIRITVVIIVAVANTVAVVADTVVVAVADTVVFAATVVAAGTDTIDLFTQALHVFNIVPNFIQCGICPLFQLLIW